MDTEDGSGDAEAKDEAMNGGELVVEGSPLAEAQVSKQFGAAPNRFEGDNIESARGSRQSVRQAAVRGDRERWLRRHGAPVAHAAHDGLSTVRVCVATSNVSDSQVLGPEDVSKVRLGPLSKYT